MVFADCRSATREPPLLMAMDPSGRQTGLKTTQPDSENGPKPAGNQIAIDSVYS